MSFSRGNGSQTVKMIINIQPATVTVKNMWSFTSTLPYVMPAHSDYLLPLLCYDITIIHPNYGTITISGDGLNFKLSLCYYHDYYIYCSC